MSLLAKNRISGNKNSSIVKILRN